MEPGEKLAVKNPASLGKKGQGDESGGEDGGSEDGPSSPQSPKKGSKEETRLAKKLALDEEKERTEARKAHQAQLKAVRDEQNSAMMAQQDKSAEARLRFLVQQADVFARFMDGTQTGDAVKKEKSKAKPKEKGSGGGGDGRGRGRKTEEEEDEELMAVQLKGKNLTRLTVQPESVTGQMRPYQLEGLTWLINLYEQGINGILADEMGLGKTLQTISLLGYLKNDRNVSGPHIVVVPKSVLGNWERELHRWCPSLRVIKVHGNQEERAEQIRVGLVAGEFDVVVTSYEVIRIERSAFLKFKWRYLIMDEAHSIKNDQSRLAQTVRELSTEFRLLITGTPLQNNLRELWSLLNFLLPEVFGDAEQFEDFFKIDALAEQSVVSKLHAILRPFMIRRLKADVEDSLPPKREIKLFTGLTEMQTYYYKNTLSRDVAALNQLGGPDKSRLMNILMQLRKVCNHPYLFQGAEPGPPYFDGPHLWENAGKMVLMDKLLERLKRNGDRVLVFSQMTRLLDILEDYMRLKGYQYCRIDGSTQTDERESAMAEFNEPGSSKFIFLLSTRAGGLGINLQTANIVILYDSDWNPQMDLQAQDRAHRIGQKKEVTVFRLITEGTVEEKIVERAEKKLYLDAVVVQQGRLQEKNNNLDKNELMSMVKFGAEAIFKSNGATITDEDIDLILEKGKKLTEETATKYKTEVQHNLLNFKLDDAGQKDTFEFDGENYRGRGAGTFIALPQRARKKNYDVNAYYRDAMDSNKGDAKNAPRMPKGMTMHDFQFYQKEAIEALEKKEHELIMGRRMHMQRIKEAKLAEKRAGKAGKAGEEDAGEGEEGKEQTEEEALAAAAAKAEAKAKAAAEAGDAAAAAAGETLESERLEAELADFEVPEEDVAEKERLVAEGFGQWNRRDFRTYLQACERHGREAREDIVNDVAEATGKTKQDIRAYHAVFWKRYKEIADWEKVLDRIKKGEQKLLRRAAITEALDKKVNRTKNPWQTLAINYGTNKGKTFTEEEDRYLICMMQRLGYGAWDQLKQEIRKAWNFRFDWFLKSRTSAELQRRCDTLVRLIEKENDDELKASGAKRKSTPAASKKEVDELDAGSEAGASKASSAKGPKKAVKKEREEEEEEEEEAEEGNGTSAKKPRRR